jgi:hypothetical protein
MPVLFNTGALLSCTRLIEYFAGEVRSPRVKSLKGLNGEIKVVGEGAIELTIFDVDGVTRTIQTNALYIPEGNIRLSSPQVYL